ncbi:MAG: protoporphyrinogen/coproporphyrinogen oxidase [Myxococcota bacterium]
MSGRRVIVLGGGPAGLGAALGLAERGFEVTLLERGDAVGGNAGSFELAGIRVDYGSHRLHPASDPAVLARLRGLLGDDLLERPRHGRIRLRGRWIHFPLRPLDLALRLPPGFALGVAWDALRRLLPSPSSRASEAGETFASILERGLGRTICRDFYFPYARRIWGLEPEQLSPVQAQRRVGSGSLGKLVRRLLPGGSGGGAPRGIFYYPRRGYGQISERLCEAAIEAGADVRLGWSVVRWTRTPPELEVWAAPRSGGAPEQMRLVADHLWSTIPVAQMARMCEPVAPAEVLRAAQSLKLRAMLLVYLVLEQDRFSEYDAHYFPGADMPLTRLSEPKNYAALDGPRGRTVLCCEVPCSPEDEIWTRDPAELGRSLLDALARAELPSPGRLLEVVVRRLPAAYPVYERGWESAFATLDAWIGAQPGVLSFGRQGLFAHDNTHHALYMADAAVRCLRDDGSFDREAWARYRTIFETHVVED